MKPMLMALVLAAFLGAAALAAEEAPANATCPVMVGNKVDPNIFVEYKGKKVYFCCAICKTAFLKDPEKYLPRLPQFAGSPPDNAPGKAGSFSPASLVEPTGIAALALLLLTSSAGLFMRKNPKLLFKWHKRLAITTLAMALTHALLAMTYF